MGCWRQQRLHLNLGQIQNGQKNLNRFIMDHVVSIGYISMIGRNLDLDYRSKTSI